MRSRRFLIVSLYVVFCVLTFGTVSEAADTTYSIAGNVYLQNQIDHSGTSVSVIGIVPTLGLFGIIFLCLLISVLLCHRHRLLGIGGGVVSLFFLISLVQAALSVITPSDGSYVLTPEAGGPFASGKYTIYFGHDGYYNKSVAITIPENGPAVLVVADVTLQSTSSGSLHAIDPIVGNMRYIEGGTFTQGSPSAEPCRAPDETQFNHTLTRNVAIMETEVTRQMWADLRAVQTTLPADPSYTQFAPTMVHPVNYLTWFEAVLFANLLSVQNGLVQCYYTDTGFTIPIDVSNYTTGPFYCNFSANGYRLLSEGEWEYAARAGTSGPFSCNETNYTSENCHTCTAGTHPVLEQYAVYCANYPATYSAPVGSKLANDWNLFDMHGNVYEWCWDWYSDYPGDTTDYTGPVSSTLRILRSSCWNCHAAIGRSADRIFSSPGSHYDSVGFRLGRTIVTSPIIHTISDVDACAQSGVSITFSGHDGATQNDLWVDGAEVAVDIINPVVYDPQDTSDHDYVIRSLVGPSSIDSASVNFADGSDSPGQPVIASVTDLDECLSNGVSIVFTGGTGATRHDLWVDGFEEASGITSPYTYVPNDTNSHDYTVRAINDVPCWNQSNSMAGTDSNVSPTPTITGPSMNTCPDLTVTLSTETGMSNYQWYHNSSPLSGETDETVSITASGNYSVSYEDATGCSGTSAFHEVTIICCSGSLYSTDTIVGNMRRLCPGTFTQGSPTAEPCRNTNETQFDHSLTRNVAIMETEVTRQMWADLLAAQPTLPADPSQISMSPTMSHPVNQPYYYETMLFANLLSLHNGLTVCYYKDADFTDPVTSLNYATEPIYCDFSASGYRLPSEGEWEYAARAGTSGPFFCDETNYTSENCLSATAGTHPILEQYAVFVANDQGTTEVVGSKLANPWGLEDMYGNLWEWCWDWYAGYPSSATDYTGPVSATSRIARGGSMGSYPKEMRSASRFVSLLGIRYNGFGFRLARTVP